MDALTCSSWYRQAKLTEWVCTHPVDRDSEVEGAGSVGSSDLRQLKLTDRVPLLGCTDLIQLIETVEAD